MEQSTDAVDSTCLDLCISLLDYDIRGDLFESVTIGFLAVLSIDSGKGVLKDACHYTPYLSGLSRLHRC